MDTGLLALTLTGRDGHAGDVLGSPPLVPYTADERHVSAQVEREIDRLIYGRMETLVLLKLYPQRSDRQPSDAGVRWLGTGGGAVRPEIAAQIAAEALGFFGPLHGSVVAQYVLDDVIVQRQRFSTAFPHITLQRYFAYDAATGDPLVGAWRARRIQNQRRETRTNRTIDIALLVLEVAKSVFPALLPA